MQSIQVLGTRWQDAGTRARCSCQVFIIYWITGCDARLGGLEYYLATPLDSANPIAYIGYPDPIR